MGRRLLKFTRTIIPICFLLRLCDQHRAKGAGLSMLMSIRSWTMRGLSMFSLLEMRGLLTSIMCSNTIATQAIWLICCSMSSVVARMSARTRWVQSRACAGLFIRSPLRWGLSSLLFWGSANRSPTLRRRHGLPNRRLLLWIRARPILPGFRFRIHSHNKLLLLFFPLPVL